MIKRQRKREWKGDWEWERESKMWKKRDWKRNVSQISIGDGVRVTKMNNKYIYTMVFFFLK